MNVLQIRDARLADVSAISVLMTELGYDLSSEDVGTRIRAYRKAGDSVLVAADGGEVIGFISFHVIPLFHASGNLGRITAMCIQSNRLREGIGRALLDRLDEIAADRGCLRIEVTSGDHRAENAHLFYQACGYTIGSRRFQKLIFS